jgi:hypothetical protein
MKKQVLAFTMLVLVAASIFAVLALGQAGKITDFAQYYVAGQMLRQGLAHHFYDYEVQGSLLRALGDANIDRVSNHPPFEALLFLPLSYFSYETAGVLWMLASITIFGFCIYLLRDLLQPLDLPSKLALAAAIFFPFLGVLVQGQDSIVLLLVYVVAFKRMERGKDLDAGLVLGLGLFRFQLVLPFLLLFLVGRKWRVLCGAAITGFLLLCVSFLLVGRSFISQYAEMLLRTAGQYDRDLHLSSAMPTLHGILSVLLANRVSPQDLNLLVIGCSGVLFGVAAWYCRKLNPELAFTAGVLLSFAVSYHSLLYDAVVLLLPATLMLNRRREHIRLVLVIFFLIALPVQSLGGRISYAFLFPVILFWLYAAITGKSSSDAGASISNANLTA